MFLLVVAIQRPKETWTDNTTTNRNLERQYNDQKKHGQAIQRPNETWTDNTTTKRNIVSFGRCISCPCFFWSLYCLSLFLLVVVLSVHVSFGRCIACPCFFWPLYCLSMFLLKQGQAIQRPKETWTDNTKTKRNIDRQYNDQNKHGQTIQRPTETWTGNTKTKRNMDRQYNDQKKKGCIVVPCFFWSLYCLSMFLLVVVLPVHVSFGRCIACPCFFC
jgi:hypothetical protein